MQRLFITRLWFCFLLVSLCLPLAGCSQPEILLTYQLPRKTPTVARSINLEGGRPYYIVMHVENMPADNHSWKSRAKVSVDGPGGFHVTARGGPHNFEARNSDGDGRFYFSEMRLATFVPPSTGTYDITLQKGEAKIPARSQVRIELRGNSWASSFHGGFVAACVNNWQLVLSLGFMLFFVVPVFIMNLLKEDKGKKGYSSSSSSYSSCSSCSSCGGGCGGGCGGCGS